MPRPLNSRRRGFTLLELMVAVTILALATMALMRVLDSTQRAIAGQEARILAHHAALNRAAELRLAGNAQARASLPQSVANGRHEWRVTRIERQTRAGLVEVTLQLSARGRPGASLVLFLQGEAAP